MRKKLLSCLLLPIFASLSLSLHAAPATPSAASTPTPLVVANQVTGDSAKVYINTASASLLHQALQGIGKTKAEAIVAYREEHGNFASVDELLEVKGIGSLLLERNRDKLTVN